MSVLLDLELLASSFEEDSSGFPGIIMSQLLQATQKLNIQLRSTQEDADTLERDWMNEPGLEKLLRTILVSLAPVYNPALDSLPTQVITYNPGKYTQSFPDAVPIPPEAFLNSTALEETYRTSGESENIPDAERLDTRGFSDIHFILSLIAIFLIQELLSSTDINSIVSDIRNNSPKRDGNTDDNIPNHQRFFVSLSEAAELLSSFINSTVDLIANIDPFLAFRFFLELTGISLAAHASTGTNSSSQNITKAEDSQQKAKSSNPEEIDTPNSATDETPESPPLQKSASDLLDLNEDQIGPSFEDSERSNGSDPLSIIEAGDDIVIDFGFFPSGNTINQSQNLNNNDLPGADDTPGNSGGSPDPDDGGSTPGNGSDSPDPDDGGSTPGNGSDSPDPDDGGNTPGNGGGGSPDPDDGNNDVKSGLGEQVIVEVSPGEAVTIANFGGVGQGSPPSQEIIDEIDTIKFIGNGLTANNLQLFQNGDDLEISFLGDTTGTKVVLLNFDLENLDNLRRKTGGNVDRGNILFSDEFGFEDSFDVFDADSTKYTLWNRNSVTFFNDLNNEGQGLNDSNDLMNGLGGDDELLGMSGEDTLRGDDGDDLLNGGRGNDTYRGGNGADTFVLGKNEGTDIITDFEMGTDQIVLGNGLSTNDVQLLESGNDTHVLIKGTDDLLGVIQGVTGLDNSIFG